MLADTFLPFLSSSTTLNLEPGRMILLFPMRRFQVKSCGCPTAVIFFQPRFTLKKREQPCRDHHPLLFSRFQRWKRKEGMVVERRLRNLQTLRYETTHHEIPSFGVVSYQHAFMVSSPLPSSPFHSRNGANGRRGKGLHGTSDVGS